MSKNGRGAKLFFSPLFDGLQEDQGQIRNREKIFGSFWEQLSNFLSKMVDAPGYKFVSLFDDLQEKRWNRDPEKISVQTETFSG